MRIATNKKQGMTFIELTVVIFIMGIIAGIVLFNFGIFSTSISIQDTAQEIALTIEQAQRYAISGTTFGTTSASKADPSSYHPTYGVDFNLTNDPGSNAHFYIFTDINHDGFYNGLSEYIDTISIKNGDTVENVCVNEGSTCGIFPVDITFIRPYPSAHIKVNGIPAEASDAEIKIVSSRGIERTITVWNTGQVEVTASQ